MAGTPCTSDADCCIQAGDATEQEVAEQCGGSAMPGLCCYVTGTPRVCTNDDFCCNGCDEATSTCL
jgi:hypothetical protein